MRCCICGASAHGLDPAWYGVSEVEKALAPGGDPTAADNAALVADYYDHARLNNYDWTKDMSVLEFLRDFGKCAVAVISEQQIALRLV